MRLYENKIVDMGSSTADAGKDMFILFGPDVPPALKDFCYIVGLEEVDGKIEEGNYFLVNDEKFKILAVGDMAQKNLEAFGHITVHFTGNPREVMRGSIILEAKGMPKLNVGDTIGIEK